MRLPTLGSPPQIQRAIWYATSTLACIDTAGTILGRLWCCYEMFYTLISKQCAHVSAYTGMAAWEWGRGSRRSVLQGTPAAPEAHGNANVSNSVHLQALIALTPVPLSATQRTALYRKIDSAKAQCSVKEDKKKLKEHVEGYTRWVWVYPVEGWQESGWAGRVCEAQTPSIRKLV